MMTIIRSLISILVATAAILFALGNREEIAVTWSPFHDSVALPSFVLFFAGALIGFLIGGMLVWFNGSEIRRQNRKRKKTIKKLEEELENMQKAIEKHSSEEVGTLSFLEKRHILPHLCKQSKE